MSERIRVRLGGKEPRYLPANGDKKQTLYVDVAESTRFFDEALGSWVDGDPRWYEAKFTGHDADLIRDQFQKGDALLLFGEKERRSREYQGKIYNSTAFYVESFGIDPRLTTFTIDRSRRMSAEPVQASEQALEQEASQAASTDAEAEPEQRSDHTIAAENADGGLTVIAQGAHSDSSVPDPADPWAAVSQIREELREPAPAPAAPGM